MSAQINIVPKAGLTIYINDSGHKKVSSVRINRGPVSERPISTNPGLKFCSVFVFYLPRYCLE